MFEDSLVESTRHLSKRRGWMTLLSTGIQIALVAFLVILPLLRTSAISLRPNSIPVIGSYHQQPMSEANNSAPQAGPNNIRPAYIQVELRSGRFSLRNQEVGRETSPPTVPICLTDCSAGPGIPDSIRNASSNFTLRQPEQRRPPVISRLDPGQIVQRVEPLYPHLAVVTRTQGLVVLHALISREGTIEQLQALSGHPLLVPAAINAVRQWRFRPYILNGQPIEVETEITVNFTLDGSR